MPLPLLAPVRRPFTVHTLGFYDSPSFPTLAEARDVLADMVKESLRMARKRFGRATQRLDGPDSYRILIGGPNSVSIYAHHSIERL
jgi:hypothetical protein